MQMGTIFTSNAVPLHFPTHIVSPLVGNPLMMALIETLFGE
jgi:hypothetical protein